MVGDGVSHTHHFFPNDHFNLYNHLVILIAKACVKLDWYLQKLTCSHKHTNSHSMLTQSTFYLIYTIPGNIRKLSMTIYEYQATKPGDYTEQVE